MLSRFSPAKTPRLFRGALNRFNNRRAAILRLGFLYIGMSLCYCILPYVLLNDQADAWKFVNLPVIGWIGVLVAIASAWCIPHLFLIGIWLIRAARDMDATIKQTQGEHQIMTTLSRLLLVSLVLGAIAIWIAMLARVSREDGVFLSNFFAVVLLGGNLEAIFLYHRM